jgi:hypothetical protein
MGGEEIEIVRAGSGSTRAGTVGGAGEERHDRSIASTLDEADLSTAGCEDSRSTDSTCDEADFVFRNRGEVRLLLTRGIVSFELLRFPCAERAEHDVSDEELGEIEVNGGRSAVVAVVR